MASMKAMSRRDAFVVSALGTVGLLSGCSKQDAPGETAEPEIPSIYYLNTDLDLVSHGDLTPFAASLEARGMWRLHLAHGQDGLWYATFEMDEDYKEPESNIAAMLEVIEGLAEPARRAWETCAQREFNIGYDCGNEPWAFNNGASNQLLHRIAAVGASLRITIYPHRG